MSSFQENQIKDVIKSKLKEVVDEFSIDNDQLIDYIMIMIRNENTQEQIAEDLTPFMGEKAVGFSVWLEEKLKNTFISSLKMSSDASSEELNIQIDENEFNEDLNSSNEESRDLYQRSLADVKLEKIRAKRRLDEQLVEDRHKNSRKRRNKKFRAGEVRFVNNDANKISNRVKKNENMSKRKVFKISAETENLILPKKYLSELSENESKEIKVEMEIESAPKNRLTKCSFWPLCDKGDECKFLHPNKPCIMFPNCQFGQKCRYIHPQCRYDGYCSRIDCIYTHLNPKNKSLESEEVANECEVESETKSSNNASTKATNPTPSFYGSSLIQSKYFFRLSNQYNLINNKYNSIPVYCKFNTSCTNPNCFYLHTNNLSINENRMKMKWKATSLLTTADMRDDEKLENFIPNNQNSNTESQIKAVLST